MTISVIIPTRRPALVVQLLESLRAQVFDHSFEIILVDDNATKSLERLAFRTDRCECKVLAG